LGPTEVKQEVLRVRGDHIMSELGVFDLAVFLHARVLCSVIEQFSKFDQFST